MRTATAVIVCTLFLLVSGIACPDASEGDGDHGGEGSPGKARVTGIGGVFFRAEDPAALATWYETHFGIDRVPTDYDHDPWQQEAGPTVFAPFSASTGYFGDPEQSWMINLRVDDLEAMVAQLRSAGIPVDVDPEIYPNGRFARLTDPEGNPIELWEPAELKH